MRLSEVCDGHICVSVVSFHKSELIIMMLCEYTYSRLVQHPLALSCHFSSEFFSHVFNECWKLLSPQGLPYCVSRTAEPYPLKEKAQSKLKLWKILCNPLVFGEIVMLGCCWGPNCRDKETGKMAKRENLQVTKLKNREDGFLNATQVSKRADGKRV